MRTKLTESQIEELAMKIREILLKHKVWQNTFIFFNNKRLGSYDSKSGTYHHNDPNKVIIEENVNPNDYFDNIGLTLTMSFLGPLYDVFNYDSQPELLRDLTDLFREYNVYYEMGDSWNLSLYPFYN